MESKDNNQNSETIQVTQSTVPDKNTRIRRFKILRISLWVFSIFLLLLISLASLVFFYEDEVKKAIVEELNMHLNARVQVKPENIDVSILSSFPDASLNFKEVQCFDPLSKKGKDTLFYINKIGLQFNVFDLWDQNYIVKTLRIEGGTVKMRIDKNGQENYLIWKQSKDTIPAKLVDFKINTISIERLNYSFRSRKDGVKIDAYIDKALVSGNFSSEKFNLLTEAEFKLHQLYTEKKTWLADKNISCKVEIDVDKGKYAFKNVALKLNEMQLSILGNVTKSEKSAYANLKFNAKELDIKSTLSLLPESQQNRIADYESEGVFYANGSLIGNLYEPSTLQSKVMFGIQKANVKYIPSDLEIKNLNLSGYYENGNKEMLVLDDIKLELNQRSINGKFAFQNFSDPIIDLSLKGGISIGDILKFYPIDTIQSAEGDVFADLQLKGNLAKLKSNFTNESNFTKGKISANKIAVLFKSSNEKIGIESGTIDFNGANVTLDSLLIKRGTSDFLLQGQLDNFVSWIFDNRTSLQISGKISSNFLNLDEFISSGNSSKTGIVLTDQFQMDLLLDCKKVVLGKFKGSNLYGKLLVKDKKIIGEDMKLNTLGGIIYVSGLLNGSNENELCARGSARLEKIDVREMFYAFNNFGQQTLSDANVKGLASSTIEFSLSWDNNLEILPDKIKLSSSLLLERGQLIAFKPLESLSKYIELSELQNIRFSNLESEIEIRDQEIFISKTLIKNSALDLEISGKQDFNSNIDFHLKMSLSELIAKKPKKNRQFDKELQEAELDSENRRSVFFQITGTYEKPLISFDKRGMKEKIKEDLKNEKQNLKQILKEEFGLFKKDTTLKKPKENSKDSKFEIDFGNDKKVKTGTKQETIDDDDF